MRIRELTDAGIRVFEEYLIECKRGSSEAPPFSLLEDPERSRLVRRAPQVDDLGFQTRREAAAWLVATLAPLSPEMREQSAGLWSWLALFFFDRLCPAGPKGNRRPGEPHRYILSRDRRHYYRHLLWGPYKVYSLYPDSALCLLCSPFGTHGEFSEQLASRQERIVNRGLIELVDRLYYDHKGEKIKVGATTKEGPGTLRRLLTLVNQLDLTYDVYGLSADDLASLLPKEFSRWLA